MVLYEVQLMREAGMNENAFKHLELFEPHISDLLTLQETRGNAVADSKAPGVQGCLSVVNQPALVPLTSGLYIVLLSVI